MSKFSVNEEKLKEKYKQIVSFHYVSNKNLNGIDELVKNLVNVTLQQKSIGEAVPVKKNNFLSKKI